VPGTVAVALAGITPEGAGLWQASHAAEVGICEVEPGALVEGIGMMLVMPKKLRDVPLALWQLAHPLLMPAWLKPELLNLAPSRTGVAAMLVPAPT
jgi:hypothetical protein